MVPPQPFGAVPQVCPLGQVVAGLQTHWLVLLHDWPLGQVPQVAELPQVFVTVPQFCCGPQVAAGQVQVVPLQVVPPVQAAH
jgi:hypothetical protein